MADFNPQDEDTEGYEEHPDGGCTVSSDNGWKIFKEKCRQSWRDTPIWEKAWIRGGQRYNDLVFHLESWAQRAFRGYSDYDVWNYCHNTSLRAIKILQVLRDRRNGYPCAIAKYEADGYTLAEPEDSPGKRWESMLDDMVFYHKCHAEVSRPKEEYYTWKDIEISWYDSYQFKDDEEKKRYKRGRYFYMKFYGNLWE